MGPMVPLGVVRFGIFKMDSKNPCRLAAFSLDCEWSAGGRHVVYACNGKMADVPYQEAAAYSYESRTRSYSARRRQQKGGRP